MVSGLTVLKLEMVIWIPEYRLSLTTCSSARDLAQARTRTVGIWDGTRTGLDCRRVNSARANPDEPMLVCDDRIKILTASKVAARISHAARRCNEYGIARPQTRPRQTLAANRSDARLHEPEESRSPP